MFILDLWNEFLYWSVMGDRCSFACKVVGAPDVRVDKNQHLKKKSVQSYLSYPDNRDMGTSPQSDTKFEKGSLFKKFPTITVMYIIYDFIYINKSVEKIAANSK